MCSEAVTQHSASVSFPEFVMPLVYFEIIYYDTYVILIYYYIKLYEYSFDVINLYINKNNFN